MFFFIHFWLINHFKTSLGWTKNCKDAPSGIDPQLPNGSNTGCHRDPEERGVGEGRKKTVTRWMFVLVGRVLLRRKVKGFSCLSLEEHHGKHGENAPTFDSCMVYMLQYIRTLLSTVFDLM